MGRRSAASSAIALIGDLAAQLLEVPVAEKAKPRKIAVESANGQRTIEA
jgi:hypothetical protein